MSNQKLPKSYVMANLDVKSINLATTLADELDTAYNALRSGKINEEEKREFVANLITTLITEVTLNEMKKGKEKMDKLSAIFKSAQNFEQENNPFRKFFDE
jgi:hypothetical protein